MWKLRVDIKLGIKFSDPAEGMDVCLLVVLCIFK